MINSKLLDCDTQPEVEENFNRLIDLQNADFGGNVWLIELYVYENDSYAPVKVIKRGSEIPYRLAADYLGHWLIGDVLSGQIRRDYDVIGWYYRDAETGQTHQITESTITDLMGISVAMGSNNVDAYIDLKSGYFITAD